MILKKKGKKQGLLSIFRSEDSGMIQLSLKIYTDEKEEENMFGKIRIFLSEDNKKILTEIVIDYKKFKNIQFDNKKIKEEENNIKNIIEYSFKENNDENSLESESGKNIQDIKQEFLIPHFTMNFTLLSDQIMLNSIFKDLFAIDESIRTSLKNENRINILLVSDFLEKYQKIRDIENEIEELEIKKSNDSEQGIYENIKFIENKIKYLKSVKDSLILKKFKFSIIRENRENFASISPTPIIEIPLGSYYTKIEITKANSENDISYFIDLFSKLCSIYKNKEEELGNEYIEMLEDVKKFNYVYKSKVVKKTQALATNPFAYKGSGRKCPTQPESVDEKDVIKIKYPDDIDRCIYGIMRNNKYNGEFVEYSEKLLKDKNNKFVMKIKAPKEWYGKDILYYRCPPPKEKDVDHTYPGLFRLKEPQPSFSYIPCCYKKITNNTANCQDFSEKLSKKLKPQKYPILSPLIKY